MKEQSPKQDTRQVKCPKCEQKLPKCDAVAYKKRYYHEACYAEHLKVGQDYRDLIDTICRLFSLNAPTGQIMMQLKRFRDEFKYTNKGMDLTLKYYYDILDNKTDLKYGIYIIPREYENAAEQYVRKMKIAQSAKNEKNYIEKKRIVKISLSGTDRKKKMIDMDSI